MRSFKQCHIYNTKMRTDEWLEDQLYDIWENNFADVPRTNSVLITFGKRSKRQLGCIKHIKAPTTKKIAKKLEKAPSNDNNTISLIIITSYFKDEFIPEVVVRSTIAHELAHYTHGFSSPLPKLFDHPHKGGIVRKELNKRGLGESYKLSQKWIKSNWVKYLKTITQN